MNPEQLRSGLLFFLALILSLSIHEAAHALAAVLLGDDTARRHGRLSLNPLAHLDPMGTVMIALMAFSGIGIGWAKPVPVNPLRFHSPRRDCGIVAFAGPLSNVLQAILAYWVLKLIPSAPGVYWDILYDLMKALVLVNVSLAAFNMLPVFPLDGQKVLSAILPAWLARHFDFHSVRLGAWPLLIIILWQWVLPIPGPLSLILGPVLREMIHLIELSAFWLG